MYELLKEFVKPELLGLVPALYLVGMGIKKGAVADKHIPWMLGCVGVALCGMYVLATMETYTWQSVLLGLFTAVVQGVLCAGMSVYVNQVVKQAGKE